MTKKEIKTDPVSIWVHLVISCGDLKVKPNKSNPLLNLPLLEMKLLVP